MKKSPIVNYQRDAQLQLQYSPWSLQDKILLNLMYALGFKDEESGFSIQVRNSYIYIQRPMI